MTSSQKASVMAPLGMGLDDEKEPALGTSEGDVGEHQGDMEGSVAESDGMKLCQKHQGNSRENVQMNSWLHKPEESWSCSWSAQMGSCHPCPIPSSTGGWVVGSAIEVGKATHEEAALPHLARSALVGTYLTWCLEPGGCQSQPLIISWLVDVLHPLPWMGEIVLPSSCLALIEVKLPSSWKYGIVLPSFCLEPIETIFAIAAPWTQNVVGPVVLRCHSWATSTEKTAAHFAPIAFILSKMLGVDFKRLYTWSWDLGNDFRVDWLK